MPDPDSAVPKVQGCSCLVAAQNPFPFAINSMCPPLSLEEKCYWIAIVHITGKANKLRSQILESLHFAQENETKKHTVTLPTLAKKSNYELLSQIVFNPV